MFNENVKNQFLSEVTKNKNQYIDIFQKASEIEQTKNKDLFDFNLPELEQLNFSTNELNLVNKYIEWALMQGIKENNINPIDFLL